MIRDREREQPTSTAISRPLIDDEHELDEDQSSSKEVKNRQGSRRCRNRSLHEDWSPEALGNQMQTHASFDAEPNEGKNAEAIHRAGKGELEASSRTYLESSSTRNLRETRRLVLPERNTLAPVHPTSISEVRILKKAMPSKQKNQEARLTTHNSPSTTRRV